MTRSVLPTSSINRRHFLVGLGGLSLAACTTIRQPVMTEDQEYRLRYGSYIETYGPIPNERFPIPALDLRKIDPLYLRQVVDYPTQEAPGTIIVDTPGRFLYLVQDGGRAMRYGVGIGRDGFSWSGRAKIGRKAPWPTWTPPAEMIKRQPELEEFRNGMPPGLENPLGARALYIYEGNRDTLYRIHGTSEPWSIGKAVSSGCVRLFNHDIIDLYNRVPVGTKLLVIQ